MAGLMIFLIFAFNKMFYAIYFWFISQDWVGFGWIAIGTCSISIILTLIFLMDTPKFYYSKKQYDKARKALEII